MTVFDYLVIALLVGSMLLGFWRGMVGEVLTLAGWVLAFFVAKRFGGWVSESWLSSIQDPTVRSISGWVLAFIAVLIVMALLRFALRSLLRAVGLGPADRFFGLFFGMLRGGLVVLVIAVVAGMTPLPSQDWWKQALLSPYVERAVMITLPWLPIEVQSRVHY